MDTQMSDETELPPPTKDLAIPDVEAPVPNSSEAFLINDIPRVTYSNTIVSVAVDYPEVFTENNNDRRTNTPVDDSTAASVKHIAATVKDHTHTHTHTSTTTMTTSTPKRSDTSGSECSHVLVHNSVSSLRKQHYVHAG